MTQGVLSSLTNGIYTFPEFAPHALAAFSSREFEASRDLLLFLGTFQADVQGYATAKQVHGDKIVLASRPIEEEQIEADGLVTDKRNLALVIRTADCVPVFFLGSKVPVAGLAHAGWRGTEKGIVARMIEVLYRYYDVLPGSLRVALGPAIRESCYEVGEEFTDYFPGFVRKRDSKYHCDLIGVIKKQLTGMGVPESSITDSGLCTVCSDQFYSARREGPDAGRFLSAVMLK